MAPNWFNLQTESTFSQQTFNYALPNPDGSHQSVWSVTSNISNIDTRILPLGVAVFTFAVLVIQAIAYGIFSRFRSEDEVEIDEAEPTTVVTRQPSLYDRFMVHVQGYGGPIIYACFVGRLVCVLALVYLSDTTIRQCMLQPLVLDEHWAIRCPEYFLGLTFIYSTFLSFFVLVSQPWHITLTRANTIVLLSAFCVYTYRDIWPLATYTEHPADAAEGKILYIKIALLGLAGLVIPMCMPRVYFPVDPLKPMPIPPAEITASWLSRVTYTYIDPLIMLASGVSHLAHDQLPPLSDEDRAVNQKKWSFKHMDPFGLKRRRHLFWGALVHFRVELLIMTISAILVCLLEFVAPIGINQVLRYLEKGNTSGNLRPWFWIAWLFWGPIFASLATHWYLYYYTFIRVRMEAIITQLVFEHSLRIRMKAEAASDGEKKADSNANSEATTPTASQTSSKAASVVSAEGSEEGEDTHLTRSEAGTSVTDSTVVGASRSASDATQATIKGKTKSKATPSAPPIQKKKKHSGENLLGKINNYVTTDLQNLLEGVDFLKFFIGVPFQIVIATIFLYQLLGWSALVGLTITVVFSPVAGILGNKVNKLQVDKMKKTDERVQSITEAVGVLRMIKLFGWEGKMTKRIEQKREEELSWLWKVKVLRIMTSATSLTIPTVTMLVTYMSYAVLMKEELTASTIFSSMAVFSILREQLFRISWQTMLIIDAKVSLDRVNDFIHDAELLDTFENLKEHPEKPQLTETSSDNEDLNIGFKNATFSWSLDEEDGSLTPSSRHYRLHIEEEVLFKRGKINLIIGPTGCGKTSMLMALLGEMHFMPANPDSWFNLPRKDGVAYASQESWVQNATIRDNILFGSPYNEERYKKVIDQCALQRDLELFEAGDATEVGERGLTLSGGQKARVTLARAVYSFAKIILLDDILAALDVHTSSWIVDQCLKGDILEGRTVLLVTHNVALAGPVADFVVSLGLDGSVVSQGTDVAVPLKADPALAAEAAADKEETAAGKADSEEDSNKATTGKLIMAEEIVHGHVSWKSMKLLIDGLGGNSPTFFFIAWVLSFFVMSFSKNLEPWFLGVWASQFETHPASEVDNVLYISVFSGIAIFNILGFLCLTFYYNWRAIAASRYIHNKLVSSVFGSTLRWLDETPAARITARCTNDIRTVDGQLPQDFWWVIEMITVMVAKLGVIVLFTPVFIFPGVIVAAVGWFIGQLYLKTQLCVKRELSNARSPLLAHFSAAIHGIVSIRAYGAQESFQQESMKRIDFYSQAARTSWNINRWVGFRIDVLGAAFTSGLAAYLVYGSNVGASNSGLSLNMAVSFAMAIFWLIRIYNDLEVESNSLERIQGYVDIEHEPQPSDEGKAPAAWPTSGDLRVENLSARYSQNGPKVLHEINFHVKSGERIGVVGRTGSGKSSLTLALLRCIITEGTVYLDGLPTNKVNLDSLRSNITIIPQMPELISGTLRQNLDPFDQNDDAVLNDALRAAGLFSLQDEAGEARITLDTKIAGGGGNLSVGQRQIIALARAMVRGSKLLILDEATSAIDYKTDAVIQSTLRSQLGKDTTVITIAHRLQTIMDADKILVLDGGKIVEFDSPKFLLGKEKGLLKALVDGSGDKNTLYTLAGC
ncbi:hypothetical protein CPB83DRAFT_846042 [Crepidotus variabilis]|uniref:P-loop containing nucleoside triphosphate hydrolase protein n=1 Tax=Crepidotus variabilis TaxID=179855 RepID=A0A9P6EQT8_9AGAR|nr:hypothetical protein CPB83DRAFT_846042 [Crepidotus variabilis]